MKTPHSLINATQKVASVIALSFLFLQCSDDTIKPVSTEKSGIVPMDSVSTRPTIPSSVACSECTFVVPADMKIVDGTKLGLKPGSVIGLNSTVTYGSLEFRNIIGTEDEPIIIRNCGGTVKVVATSKWHAIRTGNSRHFQITGGSIAGQYGIQLQGGEMSLKLDGLSTNFEVDHVEISGSSFAGIMAKTDPTCDDATIRGNFTMYDVLLHDNYVHDTGGEGFYVGNSFWDGMERSCGLRLPHEIKRLKIFNNVVKNTGWEAIQVGCAIQGTEIFNNQITNYGTANRQQQNNGIQIGSGTGGLVYNNFIKGGKGNGMIVMGTGDNVIYNNIIVDAGSNGVFCDERYTPGEGFKFLNNTILNPANDGIRLYAELVPMNSVLNNIIANPGSYGSYSGNRGPDDSFVYLLSPNVKVRMSNNMFARAVADVQFVDAAKDNYRLLQSSPAINDGRDISKYKIEKDYYLSSRLKGQAVDIGASEY